jgi:hypothetical protein
MTTDRDGGGVSAPMPWWLVADEIVGRHGGTVEEPGVYRFPGCYRCTKAFIELQGVLPDVVFSARADCLFVVPEVERRQAPGKPKVVCLCGSTRFRAAYARAFYDEEHAGRIVLSVPCYKDDPCCKTNEAHDRLDRLHRAKIDLADEILVLNVGGYVGVSTQHEIAYARKAGKVVRFLEPGADDRHGNDTLPEAKPDGQ